MNVNLITSARAADLEPLSGMAHLHAVPVRLEPAHAQGVTSGKCLHCKAFCRLATGWTR